MKSMVSGGTPTTPAQVKAMEEKAVRTLCAHRMYAHALPTQCDFDPSEPGLRVPHTHESFLLLWPVNSRRSELLWMIFDPAVLNVACNTCRRLIDL